MTKDQLEPFGYTMLHLLPTGEWAGLQQMIYTTGLFVGLDDVGYRTRYCYPTTWDAAIALLTWDGQGDPPGNWIKEKGRVERANPNLKGIPIVSE